jgi:hypothetical protein
MQSYPLDVEPAQIVDWLVAERRISPAEFRIDARKSVETRALPTRKELRLGEAEREDLSEVATIGTLQISAAHPDEGWLMTIVVEDEFAPRACDSSEAIEDEQEIDLEAFYDLFIRPRRGNASAIAEIEGPQSRKMLGLLLKDVLSNRHGSGRAGRAEKSLPSS